MLVRLPEDLRPLRLEVLGNYAVSVVWSDGFEDAIYPFEDIVDLANELKERQTEATGSDT